MSKLKEMLKEFYTEFWHTYQNYVIICPLPKLIFIILYKYGSFACIYVCAQYWGQHLWRPEEGMGSSGADMTETFERPRGFWDANPGPLEGHPMPLAIKPSGQPQQDLFWS